MRLWAALALLWCWPLVALGQSSFSNFELDFGTPADVPESAVLTIDQDRLFAGTLYGQRIQRDLRGASTLLAQENREIAAELEEEERALTVRRTEIDVETFRAEADAFDEKVSEIRRRQDAKSLALQQRSENERQTFLTNVLPILGEIMEDAGAVALIDQGTVLLTADRIDITQAAIERIDADLGDGAALRAPSSLPPERRPEDELLLDDVQRP